MKSQTKKKDFIINLETNNSKRRKKNGFKQAKEDIWSVMRAF